MNPTKTKGVYLQSDVRWSKAYKVLTRTSRDLFRLFLELRVMPNGKFVNNGKIKLTHKTAIKKLGKSKGMIVSAFKQLIEVGFIEVAIENEGTEGHRYKILIGSKGENDSKAKWRYYPEKNYRRKKVKTEIGKETRWKKGQKVKKHPIKVDDNGNLVE